MFCSTITLLALLASSVHASSIKARTDYPDEAVYIVNCASTGGTQLTLHDYVYWYKNDADGQAGQYPGITAKPTDPGIHDGMIYNIDWSSGTPQRPVTADLKGKKFTLHSLKSDGSKTGERVISETKLGDRDMDCYRDNRVIVDSLRNKSLNKCVVNYRCTRESHRSSTAKMYLYNDTTTIEGFNICGTGQSADPYKAFGNYAQWASSNVAPNTPYTLHKSSIDDCFIRFNTIGVDRAKPVSLSHGDVQQFWYKAISTRVDCTITIDKKKSIGANPYCKITYPSGGYLAVQSTQDSNPKDQHQKEYHFEVMCTKKKCDTNPVIGLLGGLIGALAAIAAPEPLSSIVAGSFVEMNNGNAALC